MQSGAMLRSRRWLFLILLWCVYGFIVVIDRTISLLCTSHILCVRPYAVRPSTYIVVTTNMNIELTVCLSVHMTRNLRRNLFAISPFVDEMLLHRLQLWAEQLSCLPSATASGHLILITGQRLFPGCRAG